MRNDDVICDIWRRQAAENQEQLFNSWGRHRKHFARMFQFLKRLSTEKMPGIGDQDSGFTKPLSVIAVPGMYLFYKYSEFKRHHEEVQRKKVTEKELDHLNHKIVRIHTRQF